MKETSFRPLGSFLAHWPAWRNPRFDAPAESSDFYRDRLKVHPGTLSNKGVALDLQALVASSSWLLGPGTRHS